MHNLKEGTLSQFFSLLVSTNGLAYFDPPSLTMKKTRYIDDKCLKLYATFGQNLRQYLFEL
jgi:hypothetical protein